MFLRSGDAEQLRQLLVCQLAADHAQATGVVCRTLADVLLTRRVIEMDPAAIRAGNDALCAQNHAVFAVVQLRQHDGQFVLAERANRFNTPGREHLVGIVSMMVVVMMTTAANAVLIVVMMMPVFVMVVIIVVIIIMMVMMLMLVMVVIIIVIIMMVMMLMLVMVVVIIVVMVVMMMVATLVVVVIVVAMLSHDCRKHVLRKVVVILHRGEDGLAADVVPRGGDDTRLRVMLTQERDDRLQLLLAHALRAGEQDRAGVFNLVEEELAEVLDIHAALARVRDGYEAAHAGFRNILFHALDRTDNVGKLADSARLDEDAVRMILVDDLTERLAEIADQAEQQMQPEFISVT